MSNKPDDAHNRVGPCSDCTNQKSRSSVNGTVRKGFVKCARLPGVESSIPTKYQTVFTGNKERKGFSSQTKRFISEDCENDNPAPGSYISHKSADIISPSFSKKGTGSFLSKTGRVPRHPQRGIPGPNTYDLPSSLLRKHSFGRGCSRVFRPPIALRAGGLKDLTPAPNHYHVSFNGVESNSARSSQSVFRSQTGRSVCPGSSKGPSPCHYTVNESLTRKSPPVPFSCFKSSSARILPSLTSVAPGPGAYSPHQIPAPIRRTVLPKRHYLGLAAPAVALPEGPPQPGPGQYNIVDYDDPPKHYMSSAVFVSGTSRWTREACELGLPGPGYYEPEKPTKQSFLYNPSQRWIPV